MYALGIDTSNYATSLAVIDYAAGEVVCDVKRFLPVKQGERGLRQSDALFHHVNALPDMLTKLMQKCDADKITAVGVSVRPRSVEGSYMPCFSAGYLAAVSFCASKGIGPVTVSHQDGHIAAAVFALKDKQLFNCLKLVFHISGGTTELLLCDGIKVIKTLAQSADLYAGQAVDRTGVRLGLLFPAGEQLSALAANCSADIKPKISIKDGNCSLSGLENQCMTLLEKGENTEYIAKYCLSQVGYSVLEMLKYAKKEYAELPVICAGGVMCSDVIRQIICNSYPSALFVPAKFSSDNAIGVSVIAARGGN